LLIQEVSLEFRKDINGLRAIAVIAVMIFHFFPALLPGGFAGVDVFFVISGFLMTKIIFSGLESNSFSFRSFYLARFRRILPALAMVCFCLLIFGWLYLTPMDYKLLSRHIASSISFISNIVYWKESGYFDASSNEKWLLHTWSLSVEWQFYLIYPLILVALKKVTPIENIKFILLGITVIGFIYCVISTYLWPAAAYYFLPTRAWEMLAGGIAYLYPIRLNKKNKSYVEFIGLSFILLSYTLISEDDMWPGYLSLLPVLGTFLILQSQNNNSLITGNYIFQKLGAWSYSIYLWHWPLVVLINYLSLDSRYGVLFIVLSILFGYLSFSIIEQKKLNFSYRIKGINLKKTGINTLAILIFSSIIIFYQGFERRMNDDVKLIAEQAQGNQRGKECRKSADGEITECVYGKGSLGAIVIGDSHAMAMAKSIGDNAALSGNSILDWSISGCNTVEGLFRVKHGKIDRSCTTAISSMLLEARNKYQGIPIIIINRTSQNLYGKNEEHYESLPNRFIDKVFEERSDEYRKSISRGMVNTACKLAENSPVYILRPIPELKQHVPNIMARSMLVHHTSTRVKLARSEYVERQRLAFITQDKMASSCGVKVIDPISYFCDDEFCYGDKNGIPMYRDDDHLSKFGADIISNIFAPIWNSTTQS